MSRTSRVMSPASSILRTAAWRVNRLACSGWRHNGFRDRSRLAANFMPLGGDASQPGWITTQARMFGTLAQTSDAGRVKMIALHNALRRVGRFRKGPAPAADTSGVGARGRIKHIGSEPAGLSAGPRLHHPGSTIRSSGVMRASAWRRMSGPAWRSMAHQSSTLYVVATLPLARS